MQHVHNKTLCLSSRCLVHRFKWTTGMVDYHVVCRTMIQLYNTYICTLLAFFRYFTIFKVPCWMQEFWHNSNTTIVWTRASSFWMEIKTEFKVITPTVSLAAWNMVKTKTPCKSTKASSLLLWHSIPLHLSWQAAKHLWSSYCVLQRRVPDRMPPNTFLHFRVAPCSCFP